MDRSSWRVVHAALRSPPLGSALVLGVVLDMAAGVAGMMGQQTVTVVAFAAAGMIGQQAMSETAVVAV